MSMNNLTIESLNDLMDSLPPIPQLPEAIIIPQRMFDKHVLGLQSKLNNVLNMQAELFGMKVHIDLFPRRYLPRRVLRSQYKTRAGYKHARRHWRAKEKRLSRVEGDMAYLLNRTALKLESDFVSRLWRESTCLPNLVSRTL